MSIVIETCPKCGHDLLNEVLTTYPPIPRKRCIACGWSWTGKREEVIRVPFKEEYVDDTVLGCVTKPTDNVDITILPLSDMVEAGTATVLNVLYDTATDTFITPNFPYGDERHD